MKSKTERIFFPDGELRMSTEAEFEEMMKIRKEEKEDYRIFCERRYMNLPSGEGGMKEVEKSRLKALAKSAGPKTRRMNWKFK